MALWKLLILSLFQISVAGLIWGSILFHSAGDWYWQRGWLHMGLWIVTFMVNLTLMLTKNRKVLEARLRPAKLTETFDKIIMFLFLPAMLSVPYLAGLDGAKTIGSSLASLLPIFFGVFLHTIGDTIVVWTTLVNPYLEKGVRIQDDQGHQVVTTGPYAIVRHPMYVGLVLMFCGFPLVLGSRLAAIPVFVMAILLIVRTSYEDKFLQEGLPGYSDYSETTKFKLIPGVW